MSNSEPITHTMFIPDVIERYPATRAVLDRYGLKGCGGPYGPAEPIGWFARLHGVPLEQLLRELNLVATTATGVNATTERSIGDTIFRPFFVAGLATVLTLGCVWGAINLFTIGLKQNCTRWSLALLAFSSWVSLTRLSPDSNIRVSGDHDLQLLRCR